MTGSAEELCNDKDAEVFRSCVGSAIFLSEDRWDVKFAVKELAKHMRSPTTEAFARLKRLGRYLNSTRGYAQKLQRSSDNKEIPKFIDENKKPAENDRIMKMYKAQAEAKITKNKK